MAEFLTISDFRTLVGRPRHIINHAISRFGPEPVGRIGSARVWSPSQLDAIRARDLNRLFTGFVGREFGADAFTVDRIADHQPTEATV